MHTELLLDDLTKENPCRVIRLSVSHAQLPGLSVTLAVSSVNSCKLSVDYQESCVWPLCAVHVLPAGYPCVYSCSGVTIGQTARPLTACSGLPDRLLLFVLYCLEKKQKTKKTKQCPDLTKGSSCMNVNSEAQRWWKHSLARAEALRLHLPGSLKSQVYQASQTVVVRIQSLKTIPSVCHAKYSALESNSISCFVLYYLHCVLSFLLSDSGNFQQEVWELCG